MHRVGFLFLLLPTLVNLSLPYIFVDMDDQNFATQSYKYSNFLIYFGVLLLLITGPIRLSYQNPEYFFIKLLLAALTILHSILVNIEYNSEKYMKIHFTRLILITATSSVGVLLSLYKL